MLAEIEIQQITNHKDYPYDLLLLADETVAAINKYVFDSMVFVVQEKQRPIAVFCLYPIDSNTLEIKNIAVAASHQNRGLGSKILQYIQETYCTQYPNLIVGTADCGFDQIRFYERNGFVQYGVRANFFIENYEQPIYENGQLLKDMVLLKYQSQQS
ncbi:MAG: family N-acetyltransferase [Sphingobacterium sp.]|jgi:aminoglycoside 6'-N-acetyltransferase I|uniref:GNAT family N-acetyltransferase n=1 Tax=unclassified Sphingobacterium TaxID=2609468 RepID=UPI0009851EDE|nr:GNAT family N-acetyltransferase [Sphingobacterium sp. CZ-UAM]MDF2516457.1 family N-acetyltransferase [Sphingobacterium sp.]OOG15938.1 GNAT family N-acetyltransferase [Sphingobacterium sp. CZ-UAM]